MDTLEVARILFGIPVAILLPLTITILSRNYVLSTAAALVYGAYVSAPLFPGGKFWLIIAAILAVHTVLRLIIGAQHTNISRRVQQVAIRSASRSIAFIILMFAAVLFGILIVVGHNGVYSVGRFVFDNRTVLVLTGGLVAVFIGGAAIGLIVRPLTKSMDVSEISVPRLLHVGANVGHAERLLLFILIVGGAPEAAVLALTAKSLVRLPSISSDMNQAEYYLVGTLSSATASLVAAIATRLALGLSPL